jgi:hypothetical protein
LGEETTMSRLGVVVVVVAALALGCATQRSSVGSDVTAKSALEIEAVRAKFKAAYDAGDPAGLENALSADATFAGGAKNHWTRGAKRIVEERWMPQAAVKMAGAYTITFTADSQSPQLITTATGAADRMPILVDFGTFEMAPPPEGSRPRIAGRYSIVWVQEAARGWVIKNMHMSPLPNADKAK